MKKKLLLERNILGETEILGSFFVDGKFFCYTCEDIFRDKKIQAQSCIPFGKYSVKVTMSTMFKRLVPLVWNDDKTLKVLDSDGDSWAGIRIHGGNTFLNTEGCILVGSERHVNKPTKWQDKLSQKWFTVKNWIRGSEEKRLTILLGTDTHELEIIKKY